MADDLARLPGELPIPVDDGACRHLLGKELPDLALPATGGGMIQLRSLQGRTVIYAYPRTGRPGEPLPTGWDQIPGARGCTPESLGFKELHSRFLALGVLVFGLSTQDSPYQEEAVSRLGLPFRLLSDAGLTLTRALRLPTFEVDGMILIRRLTLVLEGTTIRQVFYPVFPPDGHAQEVLDWLEARRSTQGGHS